LFLKIEAGTGRTPIAIVGCASVGANLEQKGVRYRIKLVKQK